MAFRFLLAWLAVAPLVAQSKEKPFPPHRAIGNVYDVGSALCRGTVLL